VARSRLRVEVLSCYDRTSGKKARCRSSRIRDCQPKNRLVKVTRVKEPKIRLAIICGGRSTEHEVSVCSARNVFEAVDKSKYDISLIRVEKSGRWTQLSSVAELTAAPGFKERLIPASQNSIVPKSEMLQTIASSAIDRGFDVVFPLVHGVSERTVVCKDYCGSSMCLLWAPACLGRPLEWTKT